MQPIKRICGVYAREWRKPFYRFLFIAMTFLALLLAAGWHGTWPGHVGLAAWVLSAGALGVSLRDGPSE